MAEEAAKAADVFGTAEEEAAESTARERGELERLYRTSQDTTKSIERRTEAVEEMQRKYPAYFGNLTTEQILAGKAADAYARLKTEILNAARARAYQKKMDELAEQNVKLEDQMADDQKWMDENEIKYRRAKPVQQQRLANPNWRSHFWHYGRIVANANNKNDDILIYDYEQRERQIEAAQKQIKANEKAMDKLAEKVNQYKPVGNEQGNDTTRFAPSKTMPPTRLLPLLPARPHWMKRRRCANSCRSRRQKQRPSWITSRTSTSGRSPRR